MLVIALMIAVVAQQIGEDGLVSNNLELESGFNLLLEDGDYILLE